MEGGIMSSTDSEVSILARRARRYARRGQFRKAAIAQRQHAALTDTPASWVRLGDMLRRAGRRNEALRAFHQGMYRHRIAGAYARMSSVAKLILKIDPNDSTAGRCLERFAAV